MSNPMKTLFEAACEAEVGTKWALTLSANQDVVVKKANKVVWDSSEENIPFHVYQRTDLYQLPSSPKKRDAIIHVDGFLVPFDLHQDATSLSTLTAGLLKWEGAQIGKPGWVMGHVSKTDDVLIEPYQMSMVMPDQVTFKTREQCEAAWKAECPDLFEGGDA